MAQVVNLMNYINTWSRKAALHGQHKVNKIEDPQGRPENRTTCSTCKMHGQVVSCLDTNHRLSNHTSKLTSALVQGLQPLRYEHVYC